jgi:fructokinase
MTAIVVAGEALIDRVVRADGSVVETPGGGPYNTARTIARSGVPVSFVGRLSRDAPGRRLRDGLAADGVDLAHVIDTDDPTTTAVATLDAAGTATYRFDLDGTSAPGLSLDAVLATGLRPDAIDVLHVGTLGLVLEPSATTIEALVAAVPAPTLVMLDPNARPAATADPARYRTRIARLAARADVIKVSADDLRFLDPGGDEAAALGRLLAGGATVLRTDGGRSVEIVTGSERRTVPVPSVDLVDSVGAGDAFGGGFLAAWVTAGSDRADLARLDAVTDAVRFAVTTAAITCTRAGAEPPTRAEVAAWTGPR